ncbi:RidA family protein [Nocardia rhizosphaerae]|uniref:RidA family protein n=1 Tax=Nocardia rhizosphaerae TaxID=1691571 RepID=A0ABV8LCB0_9NOCA
MSVVISNPSQLHDPTGFGYSHVARVSGELVLIAGQYDSDGAGHTTTADFAGQVDRAFANLGIALRSAGADYPQVAQLRTFIVDHDEAKLAILGAKIAEIWGDRPPAQTLLGVAALALPGMLFEVDAMAVLG